ncbi:MAG: single-stranded DNA-binding protein [Desulfobacterales bacterium]|nr:single-stranded DNA-binding protein [Desulfobacterales bacterium]
MNLNKVELIGNLVQDPAVKGLPSGLSMARFSLATEYSWRNQRTKEVSTTIEYHRILAWGRLAEVVGKYLKKGDKVYLEGRLQSREWQDDRKSRHHTTEIVASNLIMLGSKKSKKAAKESDEIVVEDVPAQ